MCVGDCPPGLAKPEMFTSTVSALYGKRLLTHGWRGDRPFLLFVCLFWAGREVQLEKSRTAHSQQRVGGSAKGGGGCQEGKGGLACLPGGGASISRRPVTPPSSSLPGVSQPSLTCPGLSVKGHSQVSQKSKGGVPSLFEGLPSLDWTGWGGGCGAGRETEAEEVRPAPAGRCAGLSL